MIMFLGSDSQITFRALLGLSSCDISDLLVLYARTLRSSGRGLLSVLLAWLKKGFAVSARRLWNGLLEEIGLVVISFNSILETYFYHRALSEFTSF